MKYKVYATVENGVSTSEAMSAGQLLTTLPEGTSNPDNLSDAELALLGVVGVETPEYPIDDYVYTPSRPVLVGDVWTVTWQQQESIERMQNKKMLEREIRKDRSAALSQCDWTQMPDVPLTAEQKAAWTVYRQALRDMTSQPNFPWSVVWPTKP
jgi:hypothetical protein